MAKQFELKSNLAFSTRKEIDRIEAISSAQRTTVEANFLTSLAPYLTNEVVLRNEANEIVLAFGETVPDEYEGFAKGAIFIKSNAADGTKGLYENQGTNTDADFNLVGSISTAEIGDGQVTAAKLAAAIALTNTLFSDLRLETGTPVNAVAATQTLTLTGAIVPGSHAESVITSDTTNVSDGETVTIGDIVYRFKDTLAQAYDVKIGANATATTETSGHLSWPAATLGDGTGDSNPGVAPETVTIDGVVYSFVDVLSETNGASAIANQVLFGADSAAALDNLKSAINGTAGAGTTYSTGTTAHPTVNATTNANDSQVIEANTKGTAGNSIAVSDTLTNGSWGAATLAGGVAGTVGLAKEVLVDSSYLYIAIAANTVTDANWRRISLGSVF